MSDFTLAFFSKRIDDGSFEYSSRIHLTGVETPMGGKIFKA
jgi:hypothetical protein